ncbi:gp16 family protein [Martelella alba]|uniref:Regulatory protein GemA n=1 Tax=Martelella alba TaxID=2590451 RepID=A0ABY2SRB1_9HYPH|nr:regulatory protein GemA [Martelella alba]TKI08644.1 regulatory protein GemA [Martelella alba]
MTPNTKALIGAIKAGQAFLQWDDDTYRHVLYRLTGKTSSTRCSLEELQKLREYMHEQGFPRKVAKRHGRRPNPGLSKRQVLGKIEALLADAGRPWDYAQTMCQHMFQVQRLDWLTQEQFTKLMQALIIDAKRRGKRENNHESGAGN